MGSVAHAQDDAASSETESASVEAAPEIDEEAQGVYARVVVERTEMRTGPGASFRRVRSASRGDVFPIMTRGTSGYWYQVELPDGTRAWIAGSAVYTHELSADEANEGRFAPEVFAPPPLPQAVGELSFNFGALGLVNGFMAIRPAFYLAPEFGIEITGAAAVGDAGRLLIATAGAIVNVFPESVVVPFAVGGGGVGFSDGNADAFLVESGVTGAMYAGGGLRFCFRYHITLRLEARIWAFYDENRYVGQEEYSGGLTVFF
jgi:hypothetical protein